MRTRYMSNSLKSYLLTGIKGIEGQSAVSMGKLFVVLGAVVCSISGLVLLLGIGFFVLRTVVDRSPPIADMREASEAQRSQVQNNSNQSTDSDTDTKLDRGGQSSRPRRRSRSSRRGQFPSSPGMRTSGDDIHDQFEAQQDAMEKAMDEQMAKAEEMHQRIREEAEERMNRARDGFTNRRQRNNSDDTTEEQVTGGEQTTDSEQTTDGEQDTEQEEPVYETWNSANGKYSIEAIYVRQTKDEVVLKKKNGKTINVKIDSLGHDEQTRLAFRE